MVHFADRIAAPSPEVFVGARTKPRPHSVRAATEASDGGSSQASQPSASTVSKNMFLQLLVAQIRNQDPLKPTDGTQFLTQLA